MSLTIASYPAAEPVTLDEVKDHLNINRQNNRFDALLESRIVAARMWCEVYLARTLVSTQYLYKIDVFPGGAIELPKAPVISVDSITYFDTTASPNTQTVSTDVYGLDSGVTPAIIYLKYGQTWPSSRGAYNDVSITFTAGYTDSMTSPRDYDDRVPDPIKAAINLIVGDLFLTRESKTDIQMYKNDTAEMLLCPFRLRNL